MDYWEVTMQDDIYFLVQEGWKVVLQGVPNADLAPPALISGRYFAKQQAAVDKLESDQDAIIRKLEELDEEHSGEDGLLADARNDKGKLTRISVRARLAEIKADREMIEERKAIESYVALMEKEADANKKWKEAQKALDQLVDAKYRKISTEELKVLIIEDKWLAALEVAIRGELDRVSQKLTERVSELAERYETPWPKMVAQVTELETTVKSDLKRMGHIW
jgi:type I restriction enzyme M protein